MAAAAARRLGSHIRDGLIITTESGDGPFPVVRGESSASDRRERRGRPSRLEARAIDTGWRGADRAAVGRRLGTDGGSDRRRDARGQGADDRPAPEERRLDRRAQQRPQAFVRDQGRPARGGRRGAGADAGDFRRRRRRPERHRIGPDRGRCEYLRRRARRTRCARRTGRCSRLRWFRVSRPARVARLPETPKPVGGPSGTARVIGSRHEAMAGAAAEARARGYDGAHRPRPRSSAKPGPPRRHASQPRRVWRAALRSV